MAVNGVYQLGKSLFDLTGLVGAAVTTYLASASRNGMLGYRVVILDPTTGTGLAGTAHKPRVKYPSTTFTAGEKGIGICMGPTDTIQRDSSYVSDCMGLYPTPQNRSVRLQLEGVAPIMTDSTVAATNIGIGDYVAASTTANFDGCVKKGTLSGNAPAASQHIVGIAMSRASMQYTTVLTRLLWQES